MKSLPRHFLATLLILFGLLGASSAQPAGTQSTPSAQAPETRQPEKKQAAEDTNEAYRHSPMVAKLGGMMGMNAESAATAFEVLNFAVLAALVGVFLARSLPKASRARTSTIQKQLVEARSATEEASARMTGIEDRLSLLDGQIADMRTQAEKDSAADEQRIKASLEDEKARILAGAEQEIAAATLQAHRQLQQYAAELAIEQAARKLVISAETDRLLVQNFARRLGSDDQKGGQN